MRGEWYANTTSCRGTWEPCIQGKPWANGWDQHLSHWSFVLCSVTVLHWGTISQQHKAAFAFSCNAKRLRKRDTKRNRMYFIKGDVNPVGFPLRKLCGRLAAHVDFSFSRPHCVALWRRWNNPPAQHPCLYDSFGKQSVCTLSKMIHSLHSFDVTHLASHQIYEHIINIACIQCCGKHGGPCWWVIDACSRENEAERAVYNAHC